MTFYKFAIFNKEGSLVTVSIEKTFNSVNHNFLIMIPEKFGFGNNSFNRLKSFFKIKSIVLPAKTIF